MKITKRQLRRIIKEAAEEEAAEFKSAAGKKTEQLMDSNAMNAFKVALDKANNKDAVKETLYNRYFLHSAKMAKNILSKPLKN